MGIDTKCVDIFSTPASVILLFTFRLDKPSFTRWKYYDFSYLILSSAEPVIRTVSTPLYFRFLHGIFDKRFKNNFRLHFFPPWNILCKLIANEYSLFSIKHYHTSWSAVYEIHHDNWHVSYVNNAEKWHDFMRICLVWASLYFPMFGEPI